MVIDMKKKVIKIMILLSMSLIALMLGAISYLIPEKRIKNEVKEIEHNVVFTLNEPKLQEINVKDNYYEMGANVIVDGIDNTDLMEIDTSNLDLNTVGEYDIIYKIKIDNKEFTEIRKVKVVDKIQPILTLKGSSSITLIKGEKYKEYGYNVSDNYDDMKDQVTIQSNVNVNVVGTYKVVYKAKDSSGNETEVIREIIVKKPNIIVVKTEDKGTEEPNVVDEGITSNKFVATGFYIEGKKAGINHSYSIKIKNNNSEFEKVISLTNINQNNYKGTIDIAGLSNGNYTLYIIGEEESNLKNKLTNDLKIVRSKIGDKLLTMTYSGDNVGFKIEDFVYVYDILIDPGHGGSETGAINQYTKESTLNLEQSLYEKARYEQHGLKVFMTRTNDTAGVVMGDADWLPVRKRAYVIGYYGVVSKIAYSNHHNSALYINNRGFEIILPSTTTNATLSNELKIYNLWKNYYPNLDNHKRFYTKNYDDNYTLFSKLSGEVYNFRNWYAVNRIPYELYNVKAVIYEGCYLSNISDYKWYYNENNWKALSEYKIKTYVEALGKTYIQKN